ncbi:hypothetical protein IWX90DRAFT_415459 [Phyllosticta citrichinensis]|uniref:Uncharacterized protein n=1 Tax=Phyllosticta citrichinensis TaxID=1130410 RepID=A0ABR1XVF2_9PEZI
MGRNPAELHAHGLPRPQTIEMTTGASWGASNSHLGNVPLTGLLQSAVGAHTAVMACRGDVMQKLGHTRAFDAYLNERTVIFGSLTEIESAWAKYDSPAVHGVVRESGREQTDAAKKLSSTRPGRRNIGHCFGISIPTIRTKLSCVSRRSALPEARRGVVGAATAVIRQRLQEVLPGRPSLCPGLLTTCPSFPFHALCSFEERLPDRRIGVVNLRSWVGSWTCRCLRSLWRFG